MQETFWSLVPAIIAIALALITKEVYVSLILGILAGALFFTGFDVLGSVKTTFGIMGEKIGGNANILIFLVLLGILVALITKSGASRAYGEWASRHIKTKRGALAATSALGALIFVDDYFNCLTVGTVMRPVTDKQGVSRAKLAYIIDATAAPVCIIAPISSWAAAVASSLPEGSSIDGFSLFLKTIPLNLYALLTLGMLVALIAFNFDFGTMKKHILRYAGKLDQDPSQKNVENTPTGKGRVLDVIVPIAVLIVFCVAGMLYTGGILDGVGIVDAFANCDSALSLVLGSFFTLIFTFILYIPRRVITFREFCGCFVTGFQSMVPAIMILCLAWTLSGVCGDNYLNAGGYVSGLVGSSSMALGILPAIFFLVALGLAFATGTSWGTFGILIPIIVPIFGDVESSLMVTTVAAVLAGAVCGDHVSPISDTTILASAGAQCNHIEHVSTQMPYALMVAGCCFVGYLVAGFTGSTLLALAAGFVLLAAALFVGYRMSRRTASS
ncbi:Na+/H+ antiporter NhaC family protein [Gehongia tenuis]|uniref:Na+/H+ antiporter NhaC family protein n=1 Tax=Gehongia tenuis TaxID=2763655 RepID=A0A926D2J1_9FIRM|nr:Na+/H+ antiporter NhaC family protein [Gehongia tenuis]MBC8530304.1 Na+/H+ antiporter NhaC family protein [Gehongia tenuis]